MLNGVGGKTIEEAKENLSQEEFLQWVEYRNIFGTLNPNITLNQRLGALAYITQAVQGGKAEYTDFVPVYPLEETPKDAISHAMKVFK